jgi:tRNA A37 threonylcarbamoyladenosine dehydratase
VCSSNINRQIQALTSTVGQNKVDSLRARIADINPACQVSTILDFVSYDTAKDYLLRHEDDGNFHPIFDCVVDCVDSAEDKCAMIALCR